MKDDDDRSQRKKRLMDRVLSAINFMVSEDLNTQEQRISPRVDCRYEVSYVDENGMKGVGYLIDISKKGIQLETSRKIKKGITVALKAPESEVLDRTAPFMAKVQWTRKGPEGSFRAGLALPPGADEDPHWLESLLHQLGYTDDGTQRRHFIRASSEISGQLCVHESDETCEVEVLNLGMGGALLKTPSELPKDGQFQLTVGPFEDLPPLSLSGTILRVVEEPDRDYRLYPSRFRPTEDRDTNILQEYILKFSDR
jgi:PilZ domain